MATADPGLGSWTPINMWAMIRNLINQGCPIVTNAGAPTNGTSGTYVNQAGPGSVLIDVTNKNIYVNTNTLASPTWTAIGGASAITLTSPTLVTPVLSGAATGTGTIPNLISGNASTAQVTGGYASDTYLAGSSIAMPPGGFIAKSRYY